MRQALLATFVGLALTILSPRASGFGQFNPESDGRASHWANLPIPVIVDGGTLFGQSNGLALVQQAVEVWNTVSGIPQLFATPTLSAIDFNLPNMTTWDVTDASVRVVFDEGGTITSYLGMDPTGGLLGVGYGFPDEVTGTAVEGVMLINGHPAAANAGDLVGTIVHEFGHILGLTHTPVGFGGLEPLPNAARPTMYPFATGFGSTLEADDEAGIRAIYGK